ncbi:MAG: hypothetical protein IJW01_07610 [Paludibacteraceae bacterium]|nr:hypothetical protein [Paludibacteraceae bacterium]
MTTFEIVSLVLNVLFVSGGIVTLVTLKPTLKKTKEQAKSVELDNDEKAAQIVMGYVVEPLKKEINALRRDVRKLNRAIDKIADCPHAADCPVKQQLKMDNDDEN